MLEKGMVFVNEVYNLRKEAFVSGIFMFDFGESDTKILNKLQVLGRLDLDEEKFTLSGGTGGLDEQGVIDFLNRLDNGSEECVKKPLSLFLEKQK
jgi:hypothetical protein